MSNYLTRLWGAITNKTPMQTHIDNFLSGEDIESTDPNIMKYSAVYACIRVLSETFASVTIDEFKKDGDNRKKTNDTGLLDILKNQPNGYMNAYNFHEMKTVQLNTEGNFYAIKDKFKNQIISLRPIQDVDLKLENNKLIYKYDNKNYTRKDIFHVVGFSNNGIIGLSPLEYFSKIINVGLTYQEFSKNFYKNAALPSGFFENPGKLNDIAYERLRKGIEKNWTGLKNAGTPMLLENGLTFNGVTIKPIDAQLLESKKWQTEDIARVYRVPLHLIQNLDKATFSNIEQQSLEFIMYTMLPWFRRDEMSINTQLLTRQQRDAGYYFEYNIQSLLRGDSKSMAEAFAVGRQWGWLSVNDIRRLLNMNSIGPEGDRYLEPMNMREAGDDEVEETNQQIVNEIKQLLNMRG